MAKQSKAGTARSRETGDSASARQREARAKTVDATTSVVALPGVNTDADPPADLAWGDVLDITLPVGVPPVTLAEQRAWAEVRKLQLETERTRLELQVLRRRERDAAADPAEAHVYTFYAGVDADSVQHCMAELGQWSRRSPGAPITIIFNSAGGAVLDGLALFDFIRHLRAAGHHVTTTALGRAASMGAVLLQAGDTRVMGANAFLLIHEVSNHSTGKVSEMEDGVEFSRRLQRRLVDILAERSNLSTQQIQRRWSRKDWWLDAGEAVEFGLADRVL